RGRPMTRTRRKQRTQKSQRMWCLCVSVAAFFSVSFVPLVSLSRVPIVSLSQSQPSFSSKVEAVRVDVLVTERDGGSAILGLGPSDFEVLDNGVPQQVDLVSFEQIPLNVILVLDMSDSVAGERLDHLRGAGAA